MIAPPRKGEPYPARLPPVREQWRRLSPVLRRALVAAPLVVIGAAFALNVTAGVTVAVLLVGVAAATATFAKNRTDRHNAAVDRGEIRTVADPHFRADGAPAPSLVERLGGLGFAADDIGAVTRFDGGWLVRRRNPRDVAVVLGEDGGCAYFDPRTVSDLWAATEYLAGRGREGDT